MSILPITYDTAKSFGLPVRSDIPPEFLDLMNLYPQPVRREPTVEYLPGRWRSRMSSVSAARRSRARNADSVSAKRRYAAISGLLGEGVQFGAERLLTLTQGWHSLSQAAHVIRRSHVQTESYLLRTGRGGTLSCLLAQTSRLSSQE
jgi:hypothetical protein